MPEPQTEPGKAIVKAMVCINYGSNWRDRFSQSIEPCHQEDHRPYSCAQAQS